MYIEAGINGKNTICLLDTGSSRNLVDFEFLKSVIGPNIKLENIELGLKGISGNTVKSQGITRKIEVRIENQRMYTKFIVVSQLAEKVILGIDFIDKIKGKLDYENHTLSNEKFVTNLIKLQSQPLEWAYTLRTTKQVTVKHEQEVLCNVVGKTALEPNEYMYHPDPNLWQHGHILDNTGCQVYLSHPTVCTKIYNPNKSPIVIPKDTCMGRLSRITDVNVCSFNSKDERTARKLELLKIEENDNITKDQKTKVKKLVEEFIDIFAVDRSELGICNLIEHEVRTTTSVPIKCKFRKIPLHLLKEVETEISDLLAHGMIEESDSPYSSPAFVIKRNNKSRLILDYRQLNKVIDRSQNPIPAASTILSQLGHDNEYFSNFDMKEGYFQVKLTKESKRLTAFSVPLVGHFHWITTPLGISSAPSMFQSLIDRLLKGIKSSVALGYLDDIIQATATFEQGLTNLKTLFCRLRQANLKLNPAKCKIMVRKLKFLGVWINKEGMSPDEDKINGIKNMSPPRTRKQCQSFLGCANFFRSHIKNMAEIIKPISDALALHGNNYRWTDEANKAFASCKKALVSAEILIFPNTNSTMHLFTDASEISIGGTIMQLVEGKFKPICYGSRVLQPAERNYATIKKELLALKHFVKLWYYFLIGKRFVAHVDAKALTAKNFLSTTNCSTMLRWVMELSEFQFDIQYQTGATNVVADALSRLPSTSDKFYQWYKNEVNPDKPRQAVINTVEILKTDDEKVSDVQSIAELQRQDEVLSIVLTWLENKQRPTRLSNVNHVDLNVYYSNFDRLSINSETGVLQFEYFSKKLQASRLLICAPTSEKLIIMQLNHDNPIGGHVGHVRSLEKVRTRFYWPHMSRDVENYVQLCETCYRTNLKYAKKPKANLSIFTANYPGEFLCCDLIGPLTPSAGKVWIVTMTDKFSRYSRAVGITQASSENIAKVILSDWISHEGLFKILLTDQGANLTTSSIMLELYNVLQVDKRQTVAYRPSTNGLVERYNRSLVNILKKYTQEFPSTWSKKLSLACLAHNTAYNKSTNLTPFLIMKGRNCTLPHDLVYDTQTTVYYRDEQHYQSKMYFEIRQIWDLAVKNNLRFAMQTKRRHDLNIKDKVDYKIGDNVLIWKPIKEKTFRKLRNNFIGPFKIVKKLGDYNYKIVDEKTGKFQVVNYESMRYFDPNLRLAKSETEKVPATSHNRKTIVIDSDDDDTCPLGIQVDHQNPDEKSSDIALEPSAPIPREPELINEPNNLSSTEPASNEPTSSTSDRFRTPPSSTTRPTRIRKPVQKFQVDWNSESYDSNVEQ